MLGMIEDVRTVFREDPAARSALEVITCYPGLHAVWMYRVAHWMWSRGAYLPARLLSQLARYWTGVEIHPGAVIGRRFFIDHGMGVVIGETAEIGDDVLMYQGVVLGGTALEKKKRHPTLGNRVVVGAGAIVLGAINIGDRSRIGAGSVVIKEVPADTTVFGIPAKAKAGGIDGSSQLEHSRLPDPCSEMLCAVRKEFELLRRTVEEIRNK